ncbi:hypothetical protein BN136_1039 [Cronobacter universalis NCTC 9529]|nr:hypothetical protein BN136_1039 [Cronobacter universalis NCTC 9529]
MRDVREHQRENHHPDNRTGFQRHKEGKGAQRAEQRAGDINAAPSVTIGHPGEQRNGQAAHAPHQQANIKKQLARQAQILRGVAKRKRGDDIHRQQFAQAQGDDFQKRAGVAYQRLKDRRPLFRLRGLCCLRALEFRGLCHAVAHPQRAQHQHNAEQKRQTPAPAQELLVGGQVADDRHQPGGEQQAYAIPHLNAATVKRFFPGGRTLYRKQRRAAPFAAHGEPLNGAQRHQQYRRPPANGGERRQNTDAGGGDAHHPDGHHQHPLAAQAIAKVPEDNPAERAE